MTEEITLHVDKSTLTEFRGRVFGHDGMIISFSEGLIAKQCKFLDEVRFYSTYFKNFTDILPRDLIPEVVGVVDDKKYTIKADGDISSFAFSKNIDSTLYDTHPYLLMKDIVRDFKKPAILDLKLGIRTWHLGASEKKKTRMLKRCLNTTTKDLGLRARAAIWYSRQKGSWDIEGDMNYVDRKWGNKVSNEGLQDFFADFFHFSEQIPFFVKKITSLRDSILVLRSEYGVRMFSSSVLFAYDEDDVTKCDCRILDFAKTYFDIDSLAKDYNENIDDCEDMVVPALNNIIDMLQNVLQYDKNNKEKEKKNSEIQN